MVACHNDNYDLIEFLMGLGASSLDEASPTNFGQAGLQRSLYRLSVHKALCSSSYIMLNYKDPLHQAFHMRLEAERLTEVDEELSDEYHNLTTKCETFSEEYLSCVATDKELECLLSMNNPNKHGEIPPPGGPVTRILYAISTNQKAFVAHRFCQQAIDEAFTGGIPWRGLGLLSKIAICCLGVVVLPLYWVATIFLPPVLYSVSFLRWLDCPVAKFASAFVGYILFAIIVSFNCVSIYSFVDADPETSRAELFCNVYVSLWIVGRFFELVIQSFKLGFSSVWGDLWNRYDSLTMMLFLISTVTYFAGAGTRTTYSSLNDGVVKTYEITFAFGTLLVLQKSLYWLGFQEDLGKLNILLGFSLGIIVRFFMIFSIFQFSFAVALNSIMWKENILYARNCIEVRNTPSATLL